MYLRVLLLFSLTEIAFSFSSLPRQQTHLLKSFHHQTTALSMKTQSVAEKAFRKDLYRRTPLVKSLILSELLGGDVLLKLDLLQVSGSFKDRGVAHLLCNLSEKGYSRVVSSSGGNAGLAVATVGASLNMDVQVIVPETTKPLVVQKLEALGAKVTIHGRNWNEADTLARKMCEEKQEGDTTAAYISPYDHPLLWEGHSTVVDEILEDCPTAGTILCSVGGGGLLCGILEGLVRHDDSHGVSTVVAVETEGADSFGQAHKAGKVVNLDGITSIATSLGARSVTPKTLELEQSVKPNTTLQDWQCTDKQAVRACLTLAQEHKWLVEPACGAAVAPLFDNEWRETGWDKDKPVVVQVCGGSGVSIELLQQWKQQFDL